jgi:hypothetical protein
MCRTQLLRTLQHKKLKEEAQMLVIKFIHDFNVSGRIHIIKLSYCTSCLYLTYFKALLIEFHLWITVSKVIKSESNESMWQNSGSEFANELNGYTVALELFH